VFQNSEQPIHLPWYAIVQAASDRRAAQTVIHVAADEGGTSPTEMMIPVDIPLNGTSAHPEPLVSAFQLGALSPNQNSADRYRAAADLLAVGVASNAPTVGNMADATIFFGVATAADRPNPSYYFGEFDILIDTDGDGTYDYSLFNSNYGAIEISSATDTFISVLKDLKTNKNYVTGPTNVFAADVRDTAPFNTNILVMPVQASLIGLTDAGAEFYYMVKALSSSPDANIPMDTTPRVEFNAARPMVDTTSTGIESTPFHPDNTDSLSVKVDIASLKKNPAAGGMMLLHHMNKSGARLEIIRLVPASPPVSGTLWSLY
jgi:hypothetical protein